MTLNFTAFDEISSCPSRTSKAQMPVRNLENPEFKPLGGTLKRTLDMTFALLIALPLGILILGLCVLIKLQDRGPVLYGHPRVGFNGQMFRCWKFRTMVVDGDRILNNHLNKYPEERYLWLKERKLEHDPRVTPIGAVLRKLSLDELPQLINVFRGEMSLIGPRPVVFDELSNYDQSAKYYLKVRPGISGLWQVCGRSDTTYRKRVSLDRYYVSNWSLLLDIWILVRTIPAVVSTRGAR